MIGHDALFLVGEDGVLLLVAGDDHLDALLQVGLGGTLRPVADGAQGGFVDDVGQLRTGSAGGHAGDLCSRRPGHLTFWRGPSGSPRGPSGRAAPRDAAVETAGAGQRRVQGFRAVGGGQNDDAVVVLKAVHFGQQLVQRLLALIVAAQLTVALLADGVDLVDEHDAGALSLCLLEQVADLGSAHADEHLHELRAGNGEEGHIGFAGHSLGQHGFTGARRADQQHALGHLAPMAAYFRDRAGSPRSPAGSPWPRPHRPRRQI